MNFRRLNSFLKNNEFSVINSSRKQLSSKRKRFKYENNRILNLYKTIKARFVKPIPEKQRKIFKISNVFAYSRKSQDSNMAKLINLGNSSHCNSTRNFSVSMQNLYDHYYKGVHHNSVQLSLELSSSSQKSFINHRDRSVKLLSKEFLVNHNSHLGTLKE